MCNVPFVVCDVELNEQMVNGNTQRECESWRIKSVWRKWITRNGHFDKINGCLEFENDLTRFLNRWRLRSVEGKFEMKFLITV
jgi:hypothetical protein